MKKYEREPKHNRSIKPVLIVLGIVFVLCLGMVLFLRFKSNLKFVQFPARQASTSDTLKKQLDNQKGETLVQVRLTDEDINKLLNTDAPDFPLKNPTVKIKPDKIVLSGKTGSGPLSLKVDVSIVPKADNGKVTFEIKEIKAAGVSAPKVVADSVNSKLSSYLKQYSPGEDITVTDIKLYESYLMISGERK